MVINEPSTGPIACRHLAKERARTEFQGVTNSRWHTWYELSNYRVSGLPSTCDLLKLCGMRHLWIFIYLACLCDVRAATNALRSIPFPDARLSVHGLPWLHEQSSNLFRLPIRKKESFRPAVWSLAEHPSGGRIRFRTDSTELGVNARNPGFSNMHHMASVGENGLDLYIDGEYRGSAWPDGQGRIAARWKIGPRPTLHEVEIYLPLYKPLMMESVMLTEGSRIESSTGYAITKPVVYYGSSITQGGCASNPGGSYQAILERRLGADFVNLGFSGSGLGDLEIADAICELDPSCIVLDFWANPNLALFREKLPLFVARLRKSFPQVPILVVSPFYFPSEALGGVGADEQKGKREFCRSFVLEQRRKGDRRISLVDGLKMLGRSQADGLVDGVHPNSLGFYHCANGLEPELRKALKR